MKFLYWLNGPKGVTVIAIGLVAMAFSLFAFVIVDFQILLTGALSALGLSATWYLLLGVVASVFSAICVVVWRPVLPRIVIAFFSISMASHVLERLVYLPIASLRTLAACRLIVSVGVVLVFLRYKTDDRQSASE